MPYNSKEDLPSSVKDNLPPHGQEIFLSAFNNALKQYGDEETAFRVAWSAVKNKYKKKEDDWTSKESWWGTAKEDKWWTKHWNSSTQEEDQSKFFNYIDSFDDGSGRPGNSWRNLLEYADDQHTVPQFSEGERVSFSPRAADLAPYPQLQGQQGTIVGSQESSSSPYPNYLVRFDEGTQVSLHPSQLQKAAYLYMRESWMKSARLLSLGYDVDLQAEIMDLVHQYTAQLMSPGGGDPEIRKQLATRLQELEAQRDVVNLQEQAMEPALASWWKISFPPEFQERPDQNFDLQFQPGENNWMDKDFRVGDRVSYNGQEGYIEETLDVDQYLVLLDSGESAQASSMELEKVDDPMFQDTSPEPGPDTQRFIGDDPEAQNFEDPTFATREYIDDSVGQLQVGDNVRIYAIDEGQESFIDQAGTITAVNGNTYEVSVAGSVDSFRRDQIELMPTNFNPQYGGGQRPPDPNGDMGGPLLSKLAMPKPKYYEATVNPQYLESVGATQEVMVQRILDVYNRSTPEDYEGGMGWYHSVHMLCKEYAQRYDYSFEQMCAVFAVLSPNLFWDVNFVQAIAFIEAHAAGSAQEWRDIRIWTQYKYDGKPCGYPNNNEKAWNILKTGDVSLVSGQKVQTFYNNFYHGDDNPDQGATIDIWAARIALDDPLIKPNLSGGSYELIEQAYQAAADTVGISPKQMQAVTWVAYKRENGFNRDTDYVQQYVEHVGLPYDPGLQHKKRSWWQEDKANSFWNGEDVAVRERWWSIG